MTPAKIEAQRAAREAKKPAARGRASKPPVTAAKADRDLNDPATQAAILDPQPEPLTIGGEPVTLYPLPGDVQCLLVFSFIPALVEAAASLAKPDDDPTGSTVIARYSRVLVEDRALKSRLANFIARSEQPANADVEEDDPLIAMRAKLIGKTLRPSEMVAAFTLIITLNEVFGSPKAPAPAATPTTTTT